MIKRTTQLHARTTDSEAVEIRKAAEDLNITTSELLRRGALAYHRKLIAMRRANADRQRHQQDPSK